MKVKSLFILFFISICSIAMQAQDVNFEAKVSKKKLGINERLRVDFAMNQDGDNFTPPSFDGFLVVGGPNQSISNSYINGKRSYSKTYSYFLSPQKMGKINIGTASILINGQTYTSEPVTVQITKETVNPLDGSNPDYVANAAVHLVAEISDSNPFLNEAITVVYKLYVSKDVSITSAWQEVNSPKYEDFWSQNLDARGNYKVYNGKYQGEDYRYVILRSTVLYPQKTGELDIAPLTLSVPIDVPSNRRDFFGRQIPTRVNKTISAGKRTIKVRPLPLQNRPDDFTDAVGDFTLYMDTNKKQLNANESLELDVKITGTGNLKLMGLPKVNLPSSLEVYEPERDNNIKVTANGMQGTISEKYTVIPQFKGQYPIRPITFSYFDPSTETYKTLSSEELIIDVPEGPSNNDDVAINENNNATNSINNQFKNIKLSANLEPVAKEHFFKSTLFWSLVGGPFLLIPLFLLAGRARERRLADVDGNRLRNANKLAKKFLGSAKKNLGNKETFYESMELALHNYLKAKLNIETTEMSKERIAFLLTAQNVKETTVLEFNSLLKSCEFARYTPSTSVKMKEDFDNAVRIIATIDKEIK
ncbi:batD protein [unidentified eubacterium SCB49]|nr:batD protein [unidentified eubacterium SCB49]